MKIRVIDTRGQIDGNALFSQDVARDDAFAQFFAGPHAFAQALSLHRGQVVICALSN
jgi:hypothetical protein